MLPINHLLQITTITKPEPTKAPNPLNLTYTPQTPPNPCVTIALPEYLRLPPEDLP